MIQKKWNFPCLTCVLITLISASFTVILLDSSLIFGEMDKNTQEQQQHQQQNATLAKTDYNFIATGDWYCNEETKTTIQNVIKANPDLIITTGDHLKMLNLQIAGLKCLNN